jgi:hypothetical protein
MASPYSVALIHRHDIARHVRAMAGAPWCRGDSSRHRRREAGVGEDSKRMWAAIWNSRRRSYSDAERGFIALFLLSSGGRAIPAPSAHEERTGQELSAIGMITALGDVKPPTGESITAPVTLTSR